MIGLNETTRRGIDLEILGEEHRIDREIERSETHMPYSEKGEHEAEVPRDRTEGETSKLQFRGRVDNNGCLILPEEVRTKLGFTPGAPIDLIPDLGHFKILPNIHSLARIYIEPTTRCNLNCRMCIRNTWSESLGDMDPEVFEKLVGQLSRFEHLDSVMFGGFGEPTLHKDILHMIGRVTSLGLKAEIVTNGTLLDEAMLTHLMECRLDTLWVSFDGAAETSFQDIREGASFNTIVNSLKLLKKMNHDSRHPIEIGIAFVVMRRNIDDLRHLNRFAHSVGAKRVSVSNVLPYSEEMEKEILFAWVQNLENFVYWPGRMNIDLPRIDFTNTTKEALFKLLNECANISIAGNRISRGAGRCRFIDDRCTFIKWDGTVSPCMGLLHSYKTYLNSCERTIRCHSMGEISPQDLWDIWNSTEYTDFRERVRSFEFSPCHVCGGCSLMEKNEEDCYESGFPACGGCLWAHGIIQCP